MKGLKVLKQFWLHPPPKHRQLPIINLQLAFLATLLAVTLTALVLVLGWLQPLELAAFDRLVQLQSGLFRDSRILVVALTESDIRAYRQWPVSDQLLADAIAALQKHQPRVIGLDMLRDIPNEPGHAAFIQQLEQPNVVAITYLGNQPAEKVPAPAPLPEPQVGFNDLVTDPDGVVRRNLMYAYGNDQVWTSFSLQLALHYLRQECAPATSILTRAECPGIEPELTAAGEIKLGDQVFPRLQANSGGYRQIDAAGYQVLLSYKSPTTVAQQITLQQLLNQEFDPDWVRDRIVLIGVTAPSSKDLFSTPYSSVSAKGRQMPGVLIHAQMLSQFLRVTLDGEPLFRFLSPQLEVLWLLFWVGLAAILTWLVRDWVLVGIGLVVGLFFLWSLVVIGFEQHFWLPVVAPGLAFVLTGGGNIAVRGVHHFWYDHLTGLPNRGLFLRRLRRAIARHAENPTTQQAVMFLDVDRFKVVNDTLGHQSGDQLLIQITQRIQRFLRSRDCLTRISGDEFAIFLPQVQRTSEVVTLAEHLQEAIKHPFYLAGKEIYTSISLGIALNHHEQRYSAQELMRDAHTAMYQAKAKGKGRRQMFESEMRLQVLRRLRLETELRQAIARDEMILFYQPIVLLRTGEIAGFEALIRWQHPEQGFISPAEFIPVAEETGLIIPLGEWVLRTACRQLAYWLAQFPERSDHLTLSVNLSGEQLTQPHLVTTIDRILTETNVKGRGIKLEITESVAMSDVESVIETLRQLRALQLQLSIDDFGTGYSSLSYLHRFPTDTLKVDRSFVRGMDQTQDAATIVQTIVRLAHSLSMDVVAEGIETTDQLRALKVLGCEYGQGYFLSKPVNAQIATNLLANAVAWATN